MSLRDATAGRPVVCAGLLVPLASGCPISPKYVRPDVPLPPNWSADPRLAAKLAVDVEWWHTFKDPTLDRLIEIAYRQNLPLQLAGLRILEARELGIAIGQQYPTNPGAIVSATFTGLNEHNATAGDVDIYAGRYQVGFDALWEVDF
jgi:outer membrane protein TolC